MGTKAKRATSQLGSAHCKGDNMRRTLAVLLAVVVVIGAGCDGEDSPNEPAELANPASVYCEEQGGRVDIRTDDEGNQHGVCVFSDGSEVEEWAFYRGEAEPRVP
jgi:putative hemolysin